MFDVSWLNDNLLQVPKDRQKSPIQRGERFLPSVPIRAAARSRILARHSASAKRHAVRRESTTPTADVSRRVAAQRAEANSRVGIARDVRKVRFYRVADHARQRGWIAVLSMGNERTTVYSFDEKSMYMPPSLISCVHFPDGARDIPELFRLCLR